MIKSKTFLLIRASLFLLLLNLTPAPHAQKVHAQDSFYEFIPLGGTEPVQTKIPIEWDEDWLNQSSFTYNHKIARVA